MTDRQCSSCGGFCKRSGCERENVTPQPVRLADDLDSEFTTGRISNRTGRRAADELRRLHEVNAQLLEALNEMCAEFRALDLPYGSKAYDKASTAIASAKEQA